MNIESVHLCLLAVIYTIHYQSSVEIYWCLSAGARVTFLSFLFKSNMLFTLLLILLSNQQFHLNLIIHSHPSKALCCQPTLCLDMVSHLTPSRPELYMGRGELWTQVHSQETFPARAPNFRELNIEQAQLGRFATQPAVGSWLTPVVLLDDHWDAMA